MSKLSIRSLLKLNSLIKIISGSLVTLPCPLNISLFWNFGSLLGMTLVVQLLTGVFLAMYYISSSEMAFESVTEMMRNTNYGWLIRIVHANGASMFFCFLYLHMGRGIYYMSYLYNVETWLSGVTILLLVMATAFLGYVLPWGQMSFWGATVITNLFSAIPYVGSDIVIWLWGGHSVGAPTLTRFFAFHFLLPFIISGFVMVHLLFLHDTGSNNPLGVNSNYNKILFFPYFLVKDILGMLVALLIFMMFVFLNSWILGDVENFIPANPLVTPVHIQPEWYFLFAYAILRSIPSKLGGVVALAMSVVIFYFFPIFPFMVNASHSLSSSFSIISKILFWSFISSALLLTWIGACPVESPYVLTGQLLTVFYFSYFFMLILCFKMNYMMKYL